MTDLIKIHFPALRNSEYPLVVNRIIGIVEAHNPEKLRLGRSFDRLMAFRPQLATIEVRERADHDSARLHELDVDRDTLFAGICAIASAFRGMSVEAVSAPATKLMAVLEKHGSDIARDNYTAETKRLYDLLANVTAMPNAEAVLNALALGQPFLRLDEVNKQFDRLFMQRTQNQADAGRVNVRAIRTGCDRALTKLWDAIEYNIDEYGEEEYRPLVASINALNAYYRQQLAARAARKKARQDVSGEEPIAPPEG
jgi:hypothetical protein